MTTTDLMSDRDAISIDKTVKPSGNEKKKNKNGKNGKNGKGTDSSKNGANGKGKTSNGTKTGDNSPIGLLLAIMVVCAGTAVVTVLFRRKERQALAKTLNGARQKKRLVDMPLLILRIVVQVSVTTNLDF